VNVRDRTEKDLSPLEGLAVIVYQTDGYPIYMPTDLRGFLVSQDAHGAWVAMQDDHLIGHVALHRGSWEGVMELGRRATGLGEEDLAVVARLLVSPTARRRGVGRTLLRVAVAKAHLSGLQPILDVAATYQSAILLYEREGWERLGTVPFPMPDGTTVDEYVYLGPPPPQRAILSPHP
jgi:GNAT superfamily N-acetyltransferase